MLLPFCRRFRAGFRCRFLRNKIECFASLRLRLHSFATYVCLIFPVYLTFRTYIRKKNAFEVYLLSCYSIGKSYKMPVFGWGIMLLAQVLDQVSLLFETCDIYLLITESSTFKIRYYSYTHINKLMGNIELHNMFR